MGKMAWVAPVLAIGLGACSRGASDGDITASGVIECTEINIATKVPGILREVLPREGDLLDSGQVVAVIDHSDLDWQKSQAEAQLRIARANLQLALNGPQREDIAQAEAAEQQASLALEAARLDLERVSQLAATGTAPQKQLDDARTRARSAEAAQAMARATLAKLRAGTRSEQIAAARAQVEQAEAALSAVSQRIADCVVRSPRKGYVTQRIAEPGEMVPSGGTIVTLSELDPVWLKVYLTEVELAKVRLGGTAEVTLDGEPDHPRSGTVSWISPKAEFTPKNVQTKEDRVKLVFAVKISLQNPDGFFKPGLPADAVFRADRGAGEPQ